MRADLSEIRRLHAAGLPMCNLEPWTKRPQGDEWNAHPVQRIAEDATGAGIMLARAGLCSVDPDNEPLAREGFGRVGLPFDRIMASGTRTLSTRPGSGGRSTFKVPHGVDLAWIRFGTRAGGIICELRAGSPNLQDCAPGTVYRGQADAGPYSQRYAEGTPPLDRAPDLGVAPELLAWWQRMSADLAYRHEQQRLFCGADALLSVSAGKALAFASNLRVAYNSLHDVETLLVAHGYQQQGTRWAPPKATGQAGVRAIAGKQGLWQSDHGSDPLMGTFDAWAAFVALQHEGDVLAAEAAFRPEYEQEQARGFESLPAERTDALPAFQRRERTGAILPTRENLLRALQRPDLCGWHIRLDTFRNEIMLSPSGREAWRPFRDEDYTALCLRLQGGTTGFEEIGREAIREMVAYVAREFAFDTAGHWLQHLRWDGVPRVETFLPRYFAAADTPYTRATSRYLWTALAGRTLQPGIKADMAPIAVGAQGTRKSSAVAAIAPALDFFGTLDFGLRDDNLARLVQGKLVVELDELRGLRTREAEGIKSFISRQVENWVPKFKEMPARYERRCIFFGTSNRDDFLSDDTGNRRWLPFRVLSTCDPDGIARDREQLWAEGRDLFTAGGISHAEAERLASREHAAFAEQDPWEDIVRAWLREPDYAEQGRSHGARPMLQADEVLRHAVGLPNSQINRLSQERVGKVLTALGYQKVNRDPGDGKGRRRGYVSQNLFE